MCLCDGFLYVLISFLMSGRDCRAGDREGGAASIPAAEGLLRIRRPAGERLSLLQDDCSLSVCRLRQAESLSLILTSAVSIKL